MAVSNSSISEHDTRSPPVQLLRLPVEIRNFIFGCYFSSLEFQLVSKRNLSSKSIPLQCRCNQRDGNPLGLLAVSRQVREEALPHLAKSELVITALFPGWHQANRDTLGISPIHAERIQHLELRFLDSNFSFLQALPKLKEILVNPPGEVRCRRFRYDPLSESTCWSREEINGEPGRTGMEIELASSMKLMHDLVDSF